MISFDISNIDADTIIDNMKKEIVDFSNIDVSVTFKADYNQARIIRSMIWFIFDQNWIDSLWKNRFSLIWDELVNNSIEYWSMPLDKNIFRIKLEKRAPKFVVAFQVQDTGKWPFAKTSAEMEEIRKQKIDDGFTNYLWKRWRWLFQLITNMVDRLYFKDVQGWWLIVWIEKTLW